MGTKAGAAGAGAQRLLAEGGWGSLWGAGGQGLHSPLSFPPGRRDSSGIRLYYTATLRRFDAGIMELGLVYTPVMAIPPQETAFVLTGYCTDKCTQLVSGRTWGRAWHLLLPPNTREPFWGLRAPPPAVTVGPHLVVGLVVKNPPSSAGNVGASGSIPGSGRSPGGGHGNPHQYSCLENPHGQRRLAGYSPWGCTELDRAKQLSMHALSPHPSQRLKYSFSYEWGGHAFTAEGRRQCS